MRKILFFVAASFFAFQLTCFASINITGNTADISITPAGGGTPVIIKAGEPVPSITDGSTIGVLNNGITVAATDPSTVTLSILGNIVTVDSGDTVQVTINPNGAIKIYDSKGTVSIKTVEGKTISLKPGQSIIIAGKKAKNAEGYTPPNNGFGQINTQVQTEEGSRDISPVS